MNILEQTEALKDLPDQALIQQMQMPTGEIAPIFITSELRRRKRMRDDYARREAADTPTVAEEVVMAAGMPQGGIADAARALAPKTNMGQNTGMADMMPRAATQAPQRMASGGIVGMRQGGKLVKVMGANFYAFSDGEVYVENPDGSREAVTDPRVLGVIRQQANVGPERQEGTASLGSEILADASPQAPGLESVLRSDRPFSSLPPAVTDTRPAAPSDYGLGGERPSTLTDATQPAFNQEQALIDAMNPEFDTFGGEALARAEERSNLSAPSISDVSPTVDLDLTTDQRISQEDMAMAVPVPQGQPRNFTQLLSDIENPVERGKAILAQSQSDQAQPYEGGQYTFDPFAPLGQERAARAVLAQQAPDNAKAKEELARFLKSQEMTGGRPGGTTIEDTRMMNMLNAQRQAEEAANVEALRKTQPNVDVGTDPRFGDTMGLQEVLAGDFDPVSAAPSAPAKPTDTAGLMKLLQEQMTAKTGPSVGDNIGGPMGEAAAALAEVTASGPTQGEKTFNPGTGEMSPALREELNLAPTIEGEVEQLNRAIETATANNNDFLAATLTTKRDTLVKQLQGQELATDVQEAVGGALRTVGEYASDLGGLLATKYREIITANIDPVKAAGILKEYAQSDEYKFNLREQQAAERENTERAREQRLIDLSGKFPEQPRYDVDQLPGPIGAGTATDPITMGGDRVGIEAARPKARPKDVAPVAGDTTTPASPDAGGITTVSTKAINDTAKSTGLGVDAWLAIAQGGAAMAASKNPTLLGAFGEGMGVAAAGLQEQRAAEKTADLAQAKIDATLQAAQIRAAAAGERGMAPPTGSVLFTAAREDLANARQRLEELNAAKRSVKKTSKWKLDKVKVEEEITRLQNRINRLMGEGGAPSTGGAGDTKNYDVS